MGLIDRDYLRRPSSFEDSPIDGRSGWLKYLWIAAIVIGLTSAGLYLYRNIHAEFVPGEGDLIVNVNTATEAELKTIPGIGPFLARQIINGRLYDRVEDLERVPGIGHYTLNKIRPYVKVEGETENR
jgi:competence ComEA-like helix-hairpin-helix protein